MVKLAELHIAGRARSRDELSAKTLVNARASILPMAQAWDLTRRAPSKLHEAWLSDWLDERKWGRLQASSYNSYLPPLRVFCRWLIDRHKVSPAVLDALGRVSEARKTYTQLPIATIEAMYTTAADPWERWTLALATQTLGRDGEIRSLRVGDLDLAAGYLRWFRSKTAKKDSRHDYLPVTERLDDEARRWLTYYQEQSGPLQRDWYLLPRRHWSDAQQAWRYETTLPRGTSGLREIVQYHAERVTGTPLPKGEGTHMVRRSMARALYERLIAEGSSQPGSASVVQALLGHSSVQMTYRYIGVEPDRLERDRLLRGSRLLAVPVSTELGKLKVVDNGGQG